MVIYPLLQSEATLSTCPQISKVRRAADGKLLMRAASHGTQIRKAIRMQAIYPVNRGWKHVSRSVAHRLSQDFLHTFLSRAQKGSSQDRPLMGAKDAKAWKIRQLTCLLAAQPSGATFSEPVRILISISEPSLFRILEESPGETCCWQVMS